MDLKLFLVRHAKSSWDETQLHDFDRPLSKRGKRNAPKMASHLKDGNYTIKEFVSSPALRARQTAELMLEEMSIDKKSIRFEDDLYHGYIDDFLNVLKRCRRNSIVIFGHNPGIQSFSQWLCSEPNHNFPTCGIAQIQIFIQNWAKLRANCGKLISFDYPKKNN